MKKKKENINYEIRIVLYIIIYDLLLSMTYQNVHFFFLRRFEMTKECSYLAVNHSICNFVIYLNLSSNEWDVFNGEKYANNFYED